jgi:tetratricopeptide (TPR) repeat protein
MNRIEWFRGILRDRPGDRFAMYSLALELKKAGDGPGAEQAFRELLAVHPSSGAGHYQLGRWLEEEGRPEEALAAWRAGLTALAAASDPESKRSIAEIERAIAEVEP